MTKIKFVKQLVQRFEERFSYYAASEADNSLDVSLLLHTYTDFEQYQ